MQIYYLNLRINQMIGLQSKQSKTISKKYQHPHKESILRQMKIDHAVSEFYYPQKMYEGESSIQQSNLILLSNNSFSSIKKIDINNLESSQGSWGIQSKFASQLFPTFSIFINTIKQQLTQNKQFYEKYLKLSSILDMLHYFQELYIDHSSAVQIIRIVLDFIGYCKNQNGCYPPLDTSFTDNYQMELANRWQRARDNIYFFNKNSLRLLNYIVKRPQSRQSQFQGSFPTLRFDLSLNQSRKVASAVKKMCNYDIRSFCFLSNYLYSSCISLQKEGRSIQQVQAIYKEVLTALEVQNPPAPRAQPSQKQLNEHKSVKYKDLIPIIAIDLRKYRSQQEKQFELETFILERANESNQQLQRFNEILKQICYKNYGYHFKSNVKIKSRKQKVALTRIKQKMLGNIYTQIELKQRLESTIKDIYLKKIIDIYAFTSEEYSSHQQKMKQVFSTISAPIKFQISDLLRGKCVFSSINKINKCCSDIKEYIISNPDEGLKLIEIDNRLSKDNSDIVMKILFKDVIAELQLVKDLKTADYEFSHKLFQLRRSTFFTPLTQLSILNNYLSKDYLLQAKSVILANSLKNRQKYDEKITYEESLQNFKNFLHKLQVKINFFQSHPNEIDIKMMQNQQKRLTKILQYVAMQQPQYQLNQSRIKLKYGVYNYEMKDFKKARSDLEQASKQFEKTSSIIIDKARKGIQINEQEKQELDQYLKILRYKGINFLQIGNYEQAHKTYQQKLSIELNLKGENSMNMINTYMGIGNVYMYQQKYEQAKDSYHKALQIHEGLKFKDNLCLSSIYMNIGQAIFCQNDNQGALAYYLKSLEIKKRLKDKNTASVRANIGLTYKNLKNYELALEHYFKCLQIHEKTKGKESIQVAKTLDGIGLVYSSQKRYSYALEHYFRSLEIKQRVNGKESIDAALTLGNIGMVYYQQGKNKQAIQNYKLAIKIYEKANIKYKDYANALMNLGGAYFKLKNIKLAEDNFRESLKMYEKLQIKEKMQKSAYFLAKCLQAQEQYESVQDIVQIYQLDPDNFRL